mmetsp:Transcript_809/g.1489  ORF Transcript_809/g.1489 Transcript_809/m.1489 type:complete len:326 (+) Transcript_809:667-1644(+)
MDRVVIGNVQTDNRMSRLVVGSQLFLVLGHDHGAALAAHHDLVLGTFEIVHRHETATNSCRRQRAFVHQVGEVGAREPRRAARDNAQVHIGAKWHLAGVDAKNAFAALDVGIRHLNLAVEAARAQQRGIEYVGAVGCRDDDDALVGLEAVHFHQQLVKRLLTLIIAATVASATGPAHGVDFVDEDDAGRVLFRLLEHVAHTAGTDAHEHLDKVGTGDGEEGHASLTRDGAGQQRLTGARRAHQQRALGDLAAQARELLRIAQELHDFLELLLGLVDTGHVIKRHPAVLLSQELGLGFAEAHRAAFAAALHPVHEENPDADQHQYR